MSSGKIVGIAMALFWLWVGDMAFYLIFGPVALYVPLIVTVLVGLAVLIWWADRRSRTERAEREWQAERQRRVAAVRPAEARPMVARLEDPYSAAVAWASIGLGRLADPARYGIGDPGEAPTLVRVTESPAGCELVLRPHWGVNLTHFQRAAGQLAWALGAPEVRILGADPHQGTITLEALFRDPVAVAVTAPRPVEPVDLYAVRLGVRSNGTPWTEALMERNWLVAGSMGSGKSGVMRALVLATAPAARDGYVRNVGIDLKFGIEMRQLAGLVHEVATTPETARTLLKRMLAVVEQRGREMEAAGVDKHVPSPDAPLWDIIIDELAELLDDPEARSEILSLMRHIMRPGRALGVSITAFTQSPEKENIASVRNLFQRRIGLRLTEEDMLRMLYGGDARERGAGNTQLADQGTQGIAFVSDAEGGKAIERVRAYWVSGEMLAAAARMYPIYRNPKLEPPTPSAALPAGHSSNPTANQDAVTVRTPIVADPAAVAAAEADWNAVTQRNLPVVIPAAETPQSQARKRFGSGRFRRVQADGQTGGTVVPFDRTARPDTPQDGPDETTSTGTE